MKHIDMKKRKAGSWLVILTLTLLCSASADKKNYYCEYCGQKFASVSSLTCSSVSSGAQPNKRDSKSSTLKTSGRILYICAFILSTSVFCYSAIKKDFNISIYKSNPNSAFAFEKMGIFTSLEIFL